MLSPWIMLALLHGCNHCLCVTAQLTFAAVQVLCLASLLHTHHWQLHDTFPECISCTCFCLQDDGVARAGKRMMQPAMHKSMNVPEHLCMQYVSLCPGWVATAMAASGSVLALVHDLAGRQRAFALVLF